MGAKEQSGRTWPSIFWARGTLCVLISEWMREEVMRIDSLLLSCVLIGDWLREEALLKEALVAILRVNL